VGKTQVSFTSRRPQQLAPSTLTSLLACTNALRRTILRHGYAWRQPRSDSPLRGRPALFPERAPCPSIQCYIKAKAVPVAASSPEIASARPTGPELRPRSFTALRIQHSSEDAAIDRCQRRTIPFPSLRHTVGLSCLHLADISPRYHTHTNGGGNTASLELWDPRLAGPCAGLPEAQPHHSHVCYTL